jgi:hypothetical protein
LFSFLKGKIQDKKPPRPINNLSVRELVKEQSKLYKNDWVLNTSKAINRMSTRMRGEGLIFKRLIMSGETVK